jgi:lysophospholipase L1-like esterase
MSRIVDRLGFMVIAFSLSAGMAQAQPRTVVMLGDSTTLSQESPKGKKLTDQVQAELDKSKPGLATVINAGTGGATAKIGLSQLPTAVLSRKPELVTISFGLNDTGRSTPEEFVQSLKEMVAKIRKESKARIILVTSTPFINEQHAWGKTFAAKGGLDETMDKEFCERMRSLAKELNLPLCDLHREFQAAFKQDAKMKARLIRPDGVHLTEEGNARAAKHLSLCIAEVLASK